MIRPANQKSPIHGIQPNPEPELCKNAELFTCFIFFSSYPAPPSSQFFYFLAIAFMLIASFICCILNCWMLCLRNSSVDIFFLCNSFIAETHCWQEWLALFDVFYYLMKSGCIDFLDFVDKLSSRVAKSDQQILRSNHVTWLLAQIIRIEIVTNALNSDPKQVGI